MSLAEMVLDSAPTRESVQRLEDAMRLMPQLQLKTTHALSGGVYARTVFIPAGTLVTGATHKRDHLAILQGDLTAWTESGMQHFTGQNVLPGKVGAKRAVYAHSDTTWTTVCHTLLTDVLEIEADLVEKPESLQTRNLEIGEVQKCHLSQ